MFDDRYDVVSDGCLAFSIGNCFVEELFRYGWLKFGNVEFYEA